MRDLCAAGSSVLEVLPELQTLMLIGIVLMPLGFFIFGRIKSLE